MKLHAAMEAPAMTTEIPSTVPAPLAGEETRATQPKTALVPPILVQMVGRA